jgi:hypothetical protein
MTSRPPKYPALGLIAILWILNIGTANAGACAGEIEEFVTALSRDEKGEPTFVASAPQSIDAQLGHQPTRMSVEQAKKRAQSRIFAVLNHAEKLDFEGKQRECRNAMFRARILLEF